MKYAVRRLAIVAALALTAIAGVGRSPIAADGSDVTIVLTAAGAYDPSRFEKAFDAVERRVENLRSNDLLDAEDASVSRRGRDIVVRLSGVTDPAAAQELIVPVPLYFRPVLAYLPPATSAPDDAAARSTIASCDATAISALESLPTTNAADDRPDACVVLPMRDSTARLLLGPAALAGNEDVARARPRVASQQYAVVVTLRKDGLERFNTLAADLSTRPAPNNQVGIALGGVVQANPAFRESRFEGDIEISGGFSSSEATDLARLVNYGSFPVTVKRVTVG